MRTLFLHIGHGKTGSSYLQFLLARNRETLGKHGVEYPIRDEIYQRALRGEVTSGNGDDLLKALRSDDEHYWKLALELSDSNSRLYSNELLHGALTQRTIDILVPKAKEMGWEKIEILLFIRDPIEHAISCYIQTLKRSRNRSPEDINTFIENYKVPRKCLSIIKACQSHHEDIKPTVFNYTKERGSISLRLFTWLGVPVDQLESQEALGCRDDQQTAINRSLTLAEQEFCKALIDIGMPSKFLSDALVTKLPSQKSEQPRVKRSCIEAMLRRNKIAMNELNQIIGVKSGYSDNELTRVKPSSLVSDDNNTVDDETFILTRDQIKVITRSLCSHPAQRPTKEQ